MSFFEDTSFGVEEERFLSIDSRAPSAEEFNDFILSLDSGTQQIFFTRVETSGGILNRANIFSGHGTIIIKHDFCTNILEIAYPPCRNLAQFSELYKKIWGLIEQAEKKSQVKTQKGSMLPDLPRGFQLCEESSFIKRTNRLINRKIPNTELAEPLFLGCMSAAQVHLNLNRKLFYPRLMMIYNRLYLVPLIFSNGTTFHGKTYQCIRPLVYRENFSDHPAIGLPYPIPRTEKEYSDLLVRIPNKLRDYSFVSPRSYGTVEFRAGGAQDSLEKLQGLIAITTGIAAAASSVSIPRDPISTFYDVCKTGFIEPDILESDISSIKEALVDFPEFLITGRSFLEKDSEEHKM